MMKIKITIFLFVAFLLHAGSVDAQRKGSGPKAKVLTSRQIAEKVMPSVVLIITQDENGNPISQGSGFVYKPGLVVSNLHVFERATNAIVKNVKTGEISKAIEVVAMNANEDICVIRIENTKFPALPLGDSNSVRTGDEVYVASNPKGLEGSFTKGVVSSMRSESSLIQLDAAISSGSSGGVLTNQNGEAVGIIKSSLTGGQNLNFAIPINRLKLLQHQFNHPILLAGVCAYSDWQMDRLKGLPQVVTRITLRRDPASMSILSREPIVLEVKRYDLFGNNTEIILNDPLGKRISRKLFSFDENRLTKSAQVEESLISNYVFAFEEQIREKIQRRKFSIVHGQASDHRGAEKYDSEGNRVSHTIGKTVMTIYEYDSDGRTQQVIVSSGDKVQMVRRYEYKNDEYGNWIEMKDFVQYPQVSFKWSEDYAEWRKIEYFRN